MAGSGCHLVPWDGNYLDLFSMCCHQRVFVCLFVLMIVLTCLPSSTPEFDFGGKDCIGNCWGYSIEQQVALFLALPGGTFVLLWGNYLKTRIWTLWPFLFCKFEGVGAMGRHGLGPISTFCPSVFSQLLKSWSQWKGRKMWFRRDCAIYIAQ